MGVFKRKNVWWTRFTYKGIQIRKSTETSNKKLAEDVEAKIKVTIIEGKYFDHLEATKRTFKEMMDRYHAEHVVKKLSQRAIRGYTKNLLSFFGNCTLSEISPRRIVEFKTKRYADGVRPATINRECAVLKNAFNLAIREWEWCNQNPVSKVKMERENNQRDRWLSYTEEDGLLEFSPQWVKEIVQFALHTGMRMGEILSLTWNGVDFSRKTATIFFSKNGERRTIPLNQTVWSLLKEKSKVRPLMSNLVFCGKVQTPIDGHNLRRAFRRALKNAKIEDFHFHDLRHTFATRLIQSGVDIYKVQKLLGHKTLMMTQRYAHHYPESLRAGVEILDRLREISTNLAHAEKEGRSHIA
jgi:integrase